MKRKEKVSLEEFSRIVELSSAELLEISCTIRGYYRTWYKKKSDGSQRRIDAPGQRLKKIQLDLTKKLNFCISPQAHGGVKKRSIRTNALVHRQSRYSFTVDIKNAYPTVDSKMVYWLFRRMQASAQLARILTQLTTFHNQLPQGAPTSLAIFNALFGANNLLGIDSLFDMKRVAGCPLRYSRFVDNLTFSASVKIPKEVPILVEKHLAEAGFKINHKKTHFGSTKCGAIRITGINIVDKKPKIPPKKIKRFRGMIGRATMDDSVSEAQVFGIIAYAMGIEKKIPNQLLKPLLLYLKKNPNIKCPPKIRKQIDQQLKS